MKSGLVKMFSLAKELVINQPHPFTLVEYDRPTVSDRVSIVLGHDLVKIVGSFPFKYAWLRFVSDHKGRVHMDRVLLFAVDLHSRMISR